MTNNAKNVVVGKPLVSGGILLAPLATALPTTEVAALDAAYKAAGYITDNGYTKAEKLDTGTVIAWGGGVIAITQKSSIVTAKFEMAEYLNVTVQRSIYGAANVVSTAATTTTGNKMAIAGGLNIVPPHNVWVIELVAGLARGRVVFPDAQISDLDDVSYKDDEISARGVTLTCLPDAAGNAFYEYWDDGQHT